MLPLTAGKHWRMLLRKIMSHYFDVPAHTRTDLGVFLGIFGMPDRQLT